MITMASVPNTGQCQIPTTGKGMFAGSHPCGKPVKGTALEDEYPSGGGLA